MARVYSISVSKERGTLKKPLESVEITSAGILGDGHSGDWQRQVTLMNYEDLLWARQESGLDLGPGDMAENFIIEGLDFSQCQAGTRIALGEGAVVEVHQVGKENHPSVVTRSFGVSVLPHRGLFCRVIEAGPVKVGDRAEIIKG